MRHILETWDPASGINAVTLTAAAQLLKSLTMCLGMCYRMKFQPGPIIAVGPSAEWAKRELVKKRLHPLIKENPVLASLMPADLDKFTNTAMDMQGGEINVTGANSDTGLSGGTFMISAIDEAAKITQQDKEDAPESHPILLAQARTEAYQQSRLDWMSSTPNHSLHLFWQAITAGSFTHFHVECPHCRDSHFVLDCEENKDTGYRSIVWDPDARDALGLWDEAKVIQTARFICPKNGCQIENKYKAQMIRDCQPVDHNPKAPKNKKSFRLTALYNPEHSIGQHAIDFLKAKQTLFGLQEFYNHKRATVFEAVDCNLKAEDVRTLRDLSHYERGIISRKPYGLALCADVGDFQTHWVVAAIQLDDEINIIDWGTVLTIEDLLTLRHQLKYRIQGTDEWMAPGKGTVDNADQTIRVLNMCAKSNGFWHPSRGSDASSGSWGKQYLPQYNLDQYTFVTRQFKFNLYKDAIKERQSPRFTIPANTDEDLITGLSGQQLVKLPDGRQDWKKVPGDHYGDCCLRALLIREIWKADQGRTAPDLNPELATGRSYELKMPVPANGAE